MYIKIVIGIKKSQKKNTSIYNVQGMHIKMKGKEPNSILFESQLRSPIDLIKKLI